MVHKNHKILNLAAAEITCENENIEGCEVFKGLSESHDISLPLL